MYTTSKSHAYDTYFWEWERNMCMGHGVLGMGVVHVLTYLLIGVVHGSGEEIGKGGRGSCSIKLLTLHPGTPQTGKVGYQLPIS